MKYIIWLDELSKDSGMIAGGKGANLGELISIGMPVPEGFVITTKAFEDFLEKNKIKDEIERLIISCNVDETKNLLETSEKIKKIINGAEYVIEMRNEIVDAYNKISSPRKIKIPNTLALIPPGKDYALVAVRSSATTEDLPTASFAGQQASFLNIKGIRELLDAIKKCWASLYEPRAIFYRAKHGFRHASIAVIIQKMVNSEKSGVMFTVNPSTG
ncbi:MAG: PEP/pyruvate-binding domain-containing protein, partial [Candidatus Aenigmatarchaeota archaeon]